MPGRAFIGIMDRVRASCRPVIWKEADMAVTAIVGANWGDEGKGRMVDALAAEQDIVVRYQHCANAGHTVITPQGKFVLHLLPSGVLRSDKVNVLGSGVALDVDLLERDLNDLASRGV